jgi:AraC-like DNA-binding protein
MNLEQLSPYVRFATGSYTLDPCHLKERVIWDYEIMYLKEGEALVTVEETEYKGLPGDIFIFKPRQRHSISTRGNQMIRQPHVHFDLFEQSDSINVGISFRLEETMSKEERSWFRPDRLSGATPIKLPNHIRLNNPAIFEKKLFELITEYQMKLPNYEISVKGMLIQLLIYLFREYEWSQSPYIHNRRKELYDIQTYLNDHAYREVTLEELVTTFKISKYYLIRLFNATFYRNPIEYHRLLRMERAKELLKFSNNPIKQIADDLGFQNIHSFSRAFKTTEGVSPSLYRKQELYLI